MENTLRSLFDLQRFEPNDRLSKLIEATESKYINNMTVLSDDDLGLVSAAAKSHVDIKLEKRHSFDCPDN